MREFTFRLYFNRTSICYNIIECCSDAPTYDNMTHSNDLIGGTIQSRDQCQTTKAKMLSKLVISLAFARSHYIFFFDFSFAVTHQTSDKKNTHTHANMTFSERKICLYASNIVYVLILLKTKRSFYSAFQLPFVHSIRFSFSLFLRINSFPFPLFAIMFVYFSGLSIPFHLVHSRFAIYYYYY